jgi:hypothetical protein
MIWAQFDLTPKALANSSPGFEQRENGLTFECLNLTPKALANFSPGFEQRENPGLTIKRAIKP